MFNLLYNGIEPDFLRTRISEDDWNLNPFDLSDEKNFQEADLIVIGDGVLNPFDLIKEIRKSARHVAVLILVPGSKEKNYKQALVFSPAVGFHNKVLNKDVEELPAIMESMALGTVSRRSFNQNVLQKSPEFRKADLPVTSFLESFFEYSPVGAILADKVGRVLFLNKKSRDLLNETESSIIGVPLVNFFPEGKVSRQVEVLLKNPTPETIITDLRPSKYRVLELSCSEVRNNAGSVFNIIILHDVTLRIKAEEDLRASLAKVEKANSELQEMVYVVSHDLKAPVRGISTISQWLTQDYKDSFPIEGQELLDKLNRRVVRLQSLLEGVLNAYRVGRNDEDFNTFSMDEIMDELVDIVPADKNVEVTSSDLGMAYGNKNLVRQILLNLITNAINHHKETENKIKVKVWKREDEGRTVYCVTDNGPGIDPQYHNRIFRMFETLDSEEERSGTGMGLAIVKKIIQRHKGDIWIESSLGNGATFCFTLESNSESKEAHRH